jgi:CheY-like chemotaxis protein
MNDYEFIPAGVGSTGNQPSASAVDPVPEEPPRTPIILVVEDQADVLDIACEFLNSMGYRVLRAASGDEALGILTKDDAIDLLFTDIVMPGRLDGFALAKTAVAFRPELKVLYTTGYAHHLQPKDLDSADARILPKPYRPSQLRAEIERLLLGG